MALRVGMKVVCIASFDSWRNTPWWGIVIFPIEKEIYTVRALVEGFDGKVVRTGLLLAEIRNPLSSRGAEYNFEPTKFRPLVTRPTSIEVFEKLLAPMSPRVLEPVR